MNPGLRDLAIQLIRAPRAFEIKVFEEGEEPFKYSSGNFGPTFVSVKGTVSYPFFEKFCERLAQQVYFSTRFSTNVDFVAANATGGMMPGCYIAQELSYLRGKHVPLVYVRGTRKKGGQKELVTGIDNPALKPGMNCLIVEELVNYATTTTNSAEIMRSLGFEVTHGACIMSYDTSPARALLAEHRVHLIKLFTLAELADLAIEIGHHTPERIAYAFDFLADPQGWMAKRGLVRDPEGGT